MTSGVKETREVFVFVIALVNVLAALIGMNPWAIVTRIGELASVLGAGRDAYDGWRIALAEGSDGYSDAEKQLLYAEIVKLDLPNDTVEVTAEKVLKAGVALLDVLSWFQVQKVRKAQMTLDAEAATVACDEQAALPAAEQPVEA